jgi:hypothetical protein
LRASTHASGARSTPAGTSRPSRPHSSASTSPTSDAAEHNGDTGHALWDTVLTGHFGTEARHRLTLAVTGHHTSHARSRVISQIKLASLIMATNDPAEAAALGTQALDWSCTIRSRRAADDLRDLSQFGQPHEHLTEVAELHGRISTAVVV